MPTTPTCPLIDTHCHINMMVKKSFDTPLSEDDYQRAATIVAQAANDEVTTILNVGTSLVESENCIELARRFPHVYASIGIHPNDATSSWKEELKKIAHYLEQKAKNKILAIGECGMDKHYPDHDIARQHDVFKAQIELALKHDLALSSPYKRCSRRNIAMPRRVQRSGPSWHHSLLFRRSSLCTVSTIMGVCAGHRGNSNLSKKQ